MDKTERANCAHPKSPLKSNVTYRREKGGGGGKAGLFTFSLCHVILRG